MDPKAPGLIVAVPGIGYKFTAKPRAITIPAEPSTRSGSETVVYAPLHEAALLEADSLPDGADDLIALALACKSAGRPGQALELLAAAAQLAATNAMHAILSDLHWLRADLLADLGDHIAAEANLLEALAIARQHHATIAELRAAVSLARLWRGQGRREEAHDLLAPVCARIGADSGCIDVRSAYALVQELAIPRASAATH